jgi:HEAT repeat protein
MADPLLQYMTLYSLVHYVSVVLAGLTIVALAILIALQAVKRRRDEQDAGRRRELFAVAMEYLEEPAFIPAFKKQLKARDERLLIKVFVDLLPKVRGEYADNVVHLMKELGIQEKSLKDLRSPKWWRRAEACVALGYFKDPTVVNALEDALDDREVGVRLEAARSLAKLGSVGSVAGLVARLSMVDPSHSLAVQQIFRSLGKQAVPGLVAVLDTDVQESVKVVAADALGYIGEIRAVRPLLAVCDAGVTSGNTEGTRFISRNRGFSDNPQPTKRSISLQLAIMQALSQLFDPLSIEALIRATEDPVWEIRARAAECLGRMGAVEAIPRLKDLLNDNRWWVRYYAADGLFKMGPSGLDALKSSAVGITARAAEIAKDILREHGILMEATPA